jgi:DNA-3-methyladenine glycosylase II
MTALETEHELLGAWSLETSKRFWEGFAPSALSASMGAGEIRAVFLSDTDWTRVDAVVTENAGSVRIAVAGPGDLHAATHQVRRFLSLDIDARAWPEVGDRDPVIGDAQRRLPGFRPCGFYSPYEAAVWAVLSQRIRIRQASVLKADVVAAFGENGAFPTPAALRGLDLDLPGRKLEYLHAVADAAAAGLLSGSRLRSLAPDEALRQVQSITGLGPFASELVVIRGANFPDVMPGNEPRLEREMVELYGPQRTSAEISDAWRPFRAWAGVHLRALRELRTGEIAG